MDEKDKVGTETNTEQVPSTTDQKTNLIDELNKPNAAEFVKAELEFNKDLFLNEVRKTIKGELKTTTDGINYQIQTLEAMIGHGIISEEESAETITDLSTMIAEAEQLSDNTTAEIGGVAKETEVSKEAREIMDQAQEKRMTILAKKLFDTLLPLANVLPGIGDMKMIYNAATGKESDRKLGNKERLIYLMGAATGLAVIALMLKGYDFSGLTHDVSGSSFDITNFSESMTTISKHADKKTLGVAGVLETLSHGASLGATGISMVKNLIPASAFDSLQPKLANILNTFSTYARNIQEQVLQTS